MAPGKWRHVPNGICAAEWEQDRLQAALPPEHARMLAGLKREGYFMVGYAGAHGMANLLGNFVHAAQLLQGQKVMCVLVGKGPEKCRLESRVQAQGIGNCVFLPPVKKSAIPVLLEQFDALYIGLAPCDLFRYGISPNKLVDYLMAGRPIIMAINAGNRRSVMSTLKSRFRYIPAKSFRAGFGTGYPNPFLKSGSNAVGWSGKRVTAGRYRLCARWLRGFAATNPWCAASDNPPPAPAARAPPRLA